MAGTWNFYLPGESWEGTADGGQGKYICGVDGQWHLLAAA